MMKPILEKAEITLEYPDKLYMGTFERSARFDAHLDQTGISLTLHRAGDANIRRSVHMHFHYGLFAEILQALAKTAPSMPMDNIAHREAVQEAAKVLHLSLGGGELTEAPPPSGGGAFRNGRRKKTDAMTAEDEVLLLHVLE